MLFKKKQTNDTLDAKKLINPNTPFAIREAFSTLCTNVIYLPIEDKCKKIAVTSSVSSEGKTYISINLAITLANNLDNKKILLIDMDMRNPSVTRLLNMSEIATAGDGAGLSEYLAGICKELPISSTNVENLSVIFAGAEASNPAGLINSAKMVELFEKCEAEYDYIIIDTPPVNVVSDATLLVNRVNGYLIATRADYSNVNALGNVLETLNKLGAEVFGVVLSDVNPKKSSAYGRYHKYGSYNKYINE